MSHRFSGLHWTVYLFTAAVLLSLLLTLVVVSQSYWSVVFLDYLAPVMLIPYCLLGLAFLFELGRKRRGQPSRWRLAGTLAGLGIVVFFGFLVLLGPLVAPLSSETFSLQHARLHGSIYYIRPTKNDAPDTVYWLYRCNRFGFWCRPIKNLGQSADSSLTLSQEEDQLQVRQNGEIIYTTTGTD